MKSLQLFIIFFICSCSLKDSKKLPEAVTLIEVKDFKGRLIKKITTGYISGEDVYLTIITYDSSGNIILEYGAKPYGDKFKTEYKYDSSGRILEEYQYDFNNEEFENYKGAEMALYTIQDTVADFSGKEIFRKINYQYDDIKKTTRKRIYDSYIDSLNKTTNFQLTIDTSYTTRINKNAQQ